MIEWPDVWVTTEGWPVCRRGSKETTPLTREPFLWNTLAEKAGTKINTLVEQLGGPPARQASRTILSVKRLVRAYGEANQGRSPTRRSGPEWVRVEAWLSSQGLSLAQLSLECGLTPRRQKWDLDKIRELVVRYQKQNQRNPTVKGSPTWSAIDRWLRSQGTSLHQVSQATKVTRKTTGPAPRSRTLVR